MFKSQDNIKDASKHTTTKVYDVTFKIIPYGNNTRKKIVYEHSASSMLKQTLYLAACVVVPAHVRDSTVPSSSSLVWQCFVE